MSQKTVYQAGGVSITVTETSSDVKKAIEKLSKEALGASAKVIRKKLRENIPTRSKRFKNHIASWKFIDKSTGRPTLQIGFYSWQRVLAKKKKPSRASPHWIEYGTKPHLIISKRAKVMWWQDSYGTRVLHPGQEAKHILRDTVQNNIQEIRAAQEEYLAKINDIMEINDLRIADTEEEEDE